MLAIDRFIGLSWPASVEGTSTGTQPYTKLNTGTILKFYWFGETGVVCKWYRKPITWRVLRLVKLDFSVSALEPPEQSASRFVRGYAESAKTVSNILTEAIRGTLSLLTVVASSFKRYLANINLENDIAQPEATRSEKRLSVVSVTQRVYLFLITNYPGVNTL